MNQIDPFYSSGTSTASSASSSSTKLCAKRQDSTEICTTATFMDLKKLERSWGLD